MPLECLLYGISCPSNAAKLLSFYELPRALWCSVRTTNALESLSHEFRRRTKTGGSFGTEPFAVSLLWGLVTFGRLRLRRINGYRSLPLLLQQETAA